MRERPELLVDQCLHCGDLVVAEDGYWSHYRGPGSRLNRCQHTAPYGYDATPAHDGAYFRVASSVPQGTEVEEWEYGIRGDVDSPMPSREAAERKLHQFATGRMRVLGRSLIRRRVGPWVPVDAEGSED